MIKLQNNFKIFSDGIQYQLVREVLRKKKETNEEYMDDNVEGYYGDLKQALEAYVRKVMVKRIEVEDMTLKDVLQVLEELRKEIKQYD